MLRVIAGKYKGQKLLQPPLEITRPTKDFVKEAIFSMLHFKLPKTFFLDLFAGSGSISIEALSRGASKAILVEKNYLACEVIEKNIENLKINNAVLIQENVEHYLEHAHGQKFDFIYLDPPFEKRQELNNILLMIQKKQLLKSYGLIILEINNISFLQIPNHFSIHYQKKYGKIYILLISNNI